MFRNLVAVYNRGREFLYGRKTYIVGTLGIVTTIAWLLGFIPDDVAIPLLNLCGFGGLVTLRMSIGKQGK